MSPDDPLFKDSIKQLVNTVQFHKCRVDYCLKKDKNKCRFRFPK